MTDSDASPKAGRGPADRKSRRASEDARIVEAVLKTAPTTGTPEFNTALADLFDRFADRIAARHAGAADSAPISAQQRMAANVERVRGCDGKVRFASEYSATGRAEAISLNGGIAMNAYKCRFCGGWHLGHPSGGSGIRVNARTGKPNRVVLKFQSTEVRALADVLDDSIEDVVAMDGAVVSDPALSAALKVAKAATTLAETS